MDLQGIFYPSRLERQIYLPPNQLTSDLSENLRNKLVTNEGKCHSEGFIKKGSICDIEHGPFFTEVERFRGFVKTSTTFTADVCLPTNGDIIKCQVVNFNTFGIMAIAGPLNFVIRNNNNVDVKNGQIIEVEVVNVNFNHGDTHMDVYAIFASDDKINKTNIEDQNNSEELSEYESESESYDEDEEDLEEYQDEDQEDQDEQDGDESDTQEGGDDFMKLVKISLDQHGGISELPIQPDSPDDSDSLNISSDEDEDSNEEDEEDEDQDCDGD